MMLESKTGLIHTAISISFFLALAKAQTHPIATPREIPTDGAIRADYPASSTFKAALPYEFDIIVFLKAVVLYRAGI
jgi:hypothetical protein